MNSENIKIDDLVIYSMSKWDYKGKTEDYRLIEGRVTELKKKSANILLPNGMTKWVPFTAIKKKDA